MKTFFHLPRVKTVKGRHIASLWASRLFEASGIKQLFGVHLVAAVVFTGIITPQADNLLAQNMLSSEAQPTQIEADARTETTFEMPLADFRLSQNFSFWHPGIDMTAAHGTPVYAIEGGFVALTGYSLFGYGNHVILSHNHDTTSLYGHLSEITVEKGRQIARGQLIGKIGSTGWSTGDHLHLEIYKESKAFNPLDVLPVKPKDIKYDGAYYKIATSPATLLPANQQYSQATPSTDTTAVKL